MAANKRAGKKSLAQNDYLSPSAPLIGTATDVGTARAFNNGAATVTFTAQGPNAATLFTVTSSPGSFVGTGESSPVTVGGLATGTSYTFTVVASNGSGSSSASAASNSITATTVPIAPAAPTATSPNPGASTNVAGVQRDTVSWSAPTNNGGKAVTGYSWASSDGKSGTTASTSVVVNQEGGTSQTYTVQATNSNGNSASSAASNSITTFSFTPFSVFGFSPFGVFGFSPFGVFGFR
jgi:hypothetical protein